MLAVLVAVLAVQTFGRVGHGVDFETYLAASQQLWNGGDPYAVGAGAPFLYPLFLAVILWPLWHMPLVWAAAIWFALSIGSAGAAIWAVTGVHGGLGSRRVLVALAIVAVLLAEIGQNNLRNGQVNLIVVGCCGAFIWTWAQGRRWSASLWLAAAIAIKVTPAIFLIMVALRRDWRSLTVTLLATFMFAGVLPWAVAGSRAWNDSGEYVQSFLVGRSTGTDAPAEEQRPLSLPTFVRKYAGVVTPVDFLILSGAVILALAFGIDRGVARTGPHAALLGCTYLATIVFATPMTEVHHLAFLLPGLVLLMARALAGLMPPGRIVALALVILAFMVLRRVPGAAFAGVAGTWVLLGTGVFSTEIHKQGTGLREEQGRNYSRPVL